MVNSVTPNGNRESLQPGYQGGVLATPPAAAPGNSPFSFATYASLIAQVDPRQYPGANAYTADLGACVSNGIAWVAVGGSGFGLSWANRPAANTVPAGMPLFVNNVGYNGNGAYFIADPVNNVWRPMSGVLPLFSSAIAASLTGSTVATNLLSLTIPGGLLGPNGGLRVWATWLMTSGNTGTSTIRYLLGANAVAGFTEAVGGTLVSDVRQFTNANNQAAQITSVWDGFGGVGSLNGNTALNTSATDTSANFNLVFNGQLSVSGDTLKLQRYLVELIAG